MKSVQTRKYFWSLISVFSSNAGKYGPEITPYLDTFYAVYSHGYGASGFSYCFWKTSSIRRSIKLNFSKSCGMIPLLLVLLIQNKIYSLAYLVAFSQILQCYFCLLSTFQCFSSFISDCFHCPSQFIQIVDEKPICLQ